MPGRRCLASTRFRNGLHGECGAMAPQQKTVMTCAREWDSSTCSRQASALSRPAERRSFLRRKETHMSTITTTSPETSSPLTRLITRHPLIAFFVLAFAGTWIAFLPLVLAQNGMGLLPYTIPEIGPYPPSYIFAALGALLGPTLASFTVTAITTGKAGITRPRIRSTCGDRRHRPNLPSITRRSRSVSYQCAGLSTRHARACRGHPRLSSLPSQQARRGWPGQARP